MSRFFILLIIFAFTKKFDFRKITDWTFLFSENKAFLKIPRQVGCLKSFSATGSIKIPRQVGYNRDFYIKTFVIIKKTASGFFLIFV